MVEDLQISCKGNAKKTKKKEKKTKEKKNGKKEKEPKETETEKKETPEEKAAREQKEQNEKLKKEGKKAHIFPESEYSISSNPAQCMHTNTHHILFQFVSQANVVFDLL